MTEGKLDKEIVGIHFQVARSHDYLYCGLKAWDPEEKHHNFKWMEHKMKGKEH